MMYGFESLGVLRLSGSRVPPVRVKRPTLRAQARTRLRLLPEPLILSFPWKRESRLDPRSTAFGRGEQVGDDKYFGESGRA